MSLESLRVVHIKKNTLGATKPSADGAVMGAQIGPGALFLDSCQRLLWVFDELGQEKKLIGDPRLEIYSGAQAYRFLLRVALGLESEILGETEIFGQLKEAWRKNPGLAKRVSFWVEKIFEDTKEIRSLHLEHLGGVSYGSLCRKYFQSLKARQKPASTTLLVGAGALAASVAPYFADSQGELQILNRNREKSEALKLELSKLSPRSRVSVVPDVFDPSAWKLSDRVIVCIPVDPNSDQARVEAYRLGGTEGRSLLHLGGVRAQAGCWGALEGAAFLDDIFQLQKSQGNARLLRFAAAEKACDERAKLRGLGASMSIAHGWEDLALFA